MHSGSTPQVVSNFPEPEISFSTYNQGRNPKNSTSSGTSGDGNVKKGEVDNKISVANQSSEHLQLNNVPVGQGKQGLRDQEITENNNGVNSDTITLKVTQDKSSSTPERKQFIVSTGKEQIFISNFLYLSFTAIEDALNESFDFIECENKVGVDLSLFTKDSEDLIINLDLDASTGYTSSTVNSASINNQGIEAIVNVVPVQSRDFTWEIAGQFALLRSEVLSIADGVEQIYVGGYVGRGNIAIPGLPFGIMEGDVIKRDYGALDGLSLIHI